MRTKGADVFLDELQRLYDHGWRGTVFIIDDNFIGKPKAALELLSALIEWQRERRYPFEFFTQATVLLAEARNQALLEALLRIRTSRGLGAANATRLIPFTFLVNGRGLRVRPWRAKPSCLRESDPSPVPYVPLSFRPRSRRRRRPRRQLELVLCLRSRNRCPPPGRTQGWRPGGGQLCRDLARAPYLSCGTCGADVPCLDSHLGDPRRRGEAGSWIVTSETGH